MNYEHTVGTMGTSDYIIIDQRSGIELAVKTVFEQAYAGGPYVMGARIRCHTQSNSDMPVSDLAAAAVEAYPGLKWAKADSIRLSNMIATTGEIQKMDLNQVIESIEKSQLIEKLTATLVKVVGDYVTVGTPEDLVSWFTEDFNAKLDSIFGKAPAPSIPASQLN